MGSSASSENSSNSKLTECEASLLACTSNQLSKKIAFINRLGVIYSVPELYLDPVNYEKQISYENQRRVLINAANNVASIALFGFITEIVQDNNKKNVDTAEDFINILNEYLMQAYQFSKIKF